VFDPSRRGYLYEASISIDFEPDSAAAARGLNLIGWLVFSGKYSRLDKDSIAMF
jgi:hypothetical protein